MFNPVPTVEVTPCFGVNCPNHSHCACYEAVNGSTEPITRAICFNGKQYVNFVPIVQDAQIRLF